MKYFNPKQILLCIIIISINACQDHETSKDTPTKNPVRITLPLNTDPPSLNTIISDDNISYQVLDHITEGLLVFDTDHKLAPGVAESWTFDAQSGATFWLRKKALWSDGSPVTAHDFVFAWRQTVNPNTGSVYAYIMYPVKNGEAINRGDLPVEALGVKALDDHTLQVELERPTPYFLSLTAFSVYRPIKESFYKARGTRYAADTEDLLFNGPFIIHDWIHGADLLLKKNPHYWNRNAINIDEISFPYFTTDTSTTLNLFRDKKIMMSSLEVHSVKTALKERLNIRTKKPGTVNFLSFNLKPERTTANHALRQAIQAAVDVDEITNRVLGVPGSESAKSLFPALMRQRFMEEHPLYQSKRQVPSNIENFLARARAELKVDQIPPIVLLVPDNAQAIKIAEYLQQVFASKLNVELKIDRQTFKQLLAKAGMADFDIVFGTWAPDYDDPLAYAEILINKFADGSRNYNNPKMLKAFNVAATSSDTKARNAAFRVLHQLITDDIPLLPLLVTGGGSFGFYVQDPRLKNVRRSNIAGDPNFNYARVEP